MICFTLACTEGHRFESWFQDGATFDRLSEAGHLSCGVCGSRAVKKAVMAPTVRADKAIESLSTPRSPAEQALRAMREKLEKEADFVGDRFAEEARAIHDGEADERPIWGQARPAEAKALLEDGIPITPLPFAPPRKTN